jgi:signal transduction histidine kinase
VELLTEHLNSLKEDLGPNFGQTNDYLGSIEQGISRCQELAQIWQDQSRNKEHEFEKLPFSKLIRETVLFVDPLVQAQSVNLKTQISLEEDVAVSGHRGQLLRAFHNIITNAIQALEGRSDAKLTVNVEIKDSKIQMHIIDNGVGIKAEHMSRLFEDYFTTKASLKGTGLGLPISKRILEEHGGKLSLNSILGYGTTVTIVLPVCSD